MGPPWNEIAGGAVAPLGPGANRSTRQQQRAENTTATGSVEVLSIRSTTSGNVRAFVEVRIGGVIIKDVKVVQQDGQQPWVAMPAVPWTADDGTKRWKNLVELTKTLKERGSAAVIAA